MASGGDILGDVCDLLLDREISREDICLAAGLFNSLLGRRRCGVSLTPGKHSMSAQWPSTSTSTRKSAIETYLDQDNVCAGFGKANGNGLSNASGGTGDDCCRALE